MPSLVGMFYARYCSDCLKYRSGLELIQVQPAAQKFASENKFSLSATGVLVATRVAFAVATTTMVTIETTLSFVVACLGWPFSSRPVFEIGAGKWSSGWFASGAAETIW